MRILFLSNFYPPHTRGGMELSCQSAVKGLSERGHETHVLTSRHGVRGAKVEGNISRLLYLEMDLVPLRNAIDFFFLRKGREKTNRAEFRRVVHEFRPDVVFIWGMWNLERLLAADAERVMAGRVLYRFGDYWPSLPPQYVYYWRGKSQNPLLRAVKGAMRPLAEFVLKDAEGVDLEFPNCYCISQAVKSHLLELGVPVSHAEIIYNSIDLKPYIDLNASVPLNSPKLTRLLYIGRVGEDKGVHVIVEALSRLVKMTNGHQWHLTIAGQGKASYLSTLKEKVKAQELEEQVIFLGQVKPVAIPALLADHDIVVVPSLWEEPFGRVVVEGLAAERVVVGSRVGAIPEIIDHEKTGLLVPPGDSAAMAEKLQSIRADVQAAREKAKNGRQRAFEQFGLERMLDEVESTLLKVSGQVV